MFFEKKKKEQKKAQMEQTQGAVLVSGSASGFGVWHGSPGRAWRRPPLSVGTPEGSRGWGDSRCHEGGQCPGGLGLDVAQELGPGRGSVL